MIQVYFKSWNRFIIRNLCVSAEIMGSSHTFQYDGKLVVIKLPSVDRAIRDSRYDDVARVYSRKETNDEPISYLIEKLDVEVHHPEKLAIPPELLKKSPNAYELVSTEDQAKYDTILKEQTEVAERAYLYWLSIIRWTIDQPSLGENQIENHESGWSTYLIEKETEHRFWIASQTLEVEMQREVSRNQWETAHERLKTGLIMPTHIGYLHDAVEACRNGQYRRSIIDIAMACEVFIRYSVFELIPDNLNDSFKEYIEEANINQYVNRFFKNNIGQEDQANFKKLKKEISSLFSKRNKLLHMGNEEDANEKNCQRFIPIAKELFSIKIATNKTFQRTIVSSD